ncbi:MAG: ABC transporter ATP-binding protein [Tropicimonas sp.]|uniref:ABC transporter ATP-binding protein n=1 Tax=Tropicimonas sp. TaxID=2067044 RepID=UPI003A8A1FD9
MASVDIINVSKSYGNVVALSDIGINIETGSFFTLLGPSGCGKTTLLRTIAGFHFQDAGKILVNGAEIQDKPAHKRDVGMVFQDYAVFPHLSVEANVAFGLKQRKVPAAESETRVAEALRTVQLEAFAKRMPHELSGGQQQRVGLARAVVTNPNVLLMDEPLSNLDAKLRVELRAELRRMQQDLGMTTVYVTHDQEEALAMSDTVCVMYGGIIQQAASPFDIYRSPSNRFVANFVGANNFLSATLEGSRALLKAGGDAVAEIGATNGQAIVASIRPEEVGVSTGGAATGRDITIPVRVRQVSFIGREAEVAGTTQAGETIRATVRPTPDILGLHDGQEAHFGFNRDDMLIFEDHETGRRLS